MINQIYQLTKPKFINVKYQEEAIDQENHILIRPNYMRSVMRISVTIRENVIPRF